MGRFWSKTSFQKFWWMDESYTRSPHAGLNRPPQSQGRGGGRGEMGPQGPRGPATIQRERGAKGEIGPREGPDGEDGASRTQRTSPTIQRERGRRGDGDPGTQRCPPRPRALAHFQVNPCNTGVWEEVRDGWGQLSDADKARYEQLSQASFAIAAAARLRRDSLPALLPLPLADAPAGAAAVGDDAEGEVPPIQVQSCNELVASGGGQSLGQDGQIVAVGGGSEPAHAVSSQVPTPMPASVLEKFFGEKDCFADVGMPYYYADCCLLLCLLKKALFCFVRNRT